MAGRAGTAGNPVTFTDPFGLCPPKLLCDLIGASAGESATEHWAEVANNSTGLESAGATAMGLLSALWTPDTYIATAGTLATGWAASKVILSRTGSQAQTGLQRQLADHRDRLAKYKADPDAYDNKDFLKNAPTQEIRQRIIDGRIRNLERQIRNFEDQIRRQGGN